MTAKLGHSRLDQTTRSSTTSTAEQPGWPEVFRLLRGRIDEARAAGGTPAGPTELALTVVAEALAIGEAIGELPSGEAAEASVSSRSTALYSAIDSTYLDRRTRALRAALHGVDDVIWWGGLGAAS